MYLSPGLKKYWMKLGLIKVKRGYLLVIILIFLFLGKYLIEIDVGKCFLQEVPLRQVVSFLSRNNPEEAALMSAAIVFGFKQVASDFLFLQAIQHFGDWKLKREDKFNKIYPVLQVVSFTSPHFIPAYSFAALALEELGYIDEAIDFLNRGIAKNPYAFDLWLYRDFSIYLFKLKNYKKAIRGIKTALQLEGHPPILERILAYAYEKDGQIGNAIVQWEKIYNSTQDPDIKEICIRHIKRLKKE